VYRSTDGGTTWTGVPITVSGGQVRFNITALDFGSKTHGVIIGSYGVVTIAEGLLVATTTDGGDTWTEITPPPGAVGLSAAGMAGSGTIVVGGLRAAAAAGVWTTTDGGTNWTQRNILAKGVSDVEFLDDKTGFVVSYPPAGPAATNEQVLRTTDGAASWTSPTDGTIPVQVISAAWVDENNGFVGGRNAGNDKLSVARTTDGGASWTLETLPDIPELAKPNDLMECFEYPGPAAYAGTTNGTVSMLRNTAAGGTRASRYGGPTMPPANMMPNDPNAPGGGSGGTDDSGCTVAGGGPELLVLLAGLAIFYRRRSHTS